MKKYFGIALIAFISSVATYAVAEVRAKLVTTANFDGPLRNTTISKLVDKASGIACYVYYPNTSKTESDYSGNVAYASNGIGSISCVKI